MLQTCPTNRAVTCSLCAPFSRASLSLWAYHLLHWTTCWQQVSIPECKMPAASLCKCSLYTPHHHLCAWLHTCMISFRPDFWFTHPPPTLGVVLALSGSMWFKLVGFSMIGWHGPPGFNSSNIGFVLRSSSAAHTVFVSECHHWVLVWLPETHSLLVLSVGPCEACSDAAASQLHQKITKGRLSLSHILIIRLRFT